MRIKATVHDEGEGYNRADLRKAQGTEKTWPPFLFVYTTNEFWE